MRTEARFLIWSGKEKAWWKPEAQGYTRSRAEAGRYALEEALACRLDRATGNTPGRADVLVLAD